MASYRIQTISVETQLILGHKAVLSESQITWADFSHHSPHSVGSAVAGWLGPGAGGGMEAGCSREKVSQHFWVKLRLGSCVVS